MKGGVPYFLKALIFPKEPEGCPKDVSGRLPDRFKLRSKVNVAHLSKNVNRA